MKQLVLVLGLGLVLVACSSSTQPDRAPRPEPVVMAPTDSATVAPDADHLPDAFVAPLPDASPVDAAITTGTVEQEGRGRCRVDTDCVLSSYQSGCCTQACQPNAISAKLLATEQAKEDCQAFRASGKPCPPPAPCPVYTTHPIAVKCKARTCYAVMAPGPSRP